MNRQRLWACLVWRAAAAAGGLMAPTSTTSAQSYGIAGDDGRPVTPQTPFYLASLSKSFTAAAVMQLVEAGKLDLDAPVQRNLPWFRVADAAALAQITLALSAGQQGRQPHHERWRWRRRAPSVGYGAMTLPSSRNSVGVKFRTSIASCVTAAQMLASAPTSCCSRTMAWR